MIPLNYHHLYYFYVIAKEGAIAKACQKLYLAQPTLSTQLQQFEKSIGRKLFSREKQRLHLTESGRMVLDYAESIFELGRELKDTLHDRPKAGHLAIQVGVLTGTAKSFSVALIENILKFSTDAHVQIREANLGSLMHDLKEHRLDIVLTDVVVRGQEGEEISNHLVGKVPIVMVASPTLAKSMRPLPKGLDGIPLILPSEPSQVYHQLIDLLEEWKVKPKIIAEIQDVEIGRRLALLGRGVVPLNAYSVSVSVPQKGLVVLPGSKTMGIYESVYLVTRERKLTNPLAEHLIQTFRLGS